MLSGLAVVIHVLLVFWLVSGLLGRDLLYAEAARASDLQRLRWLLDMANVFETRVLRPATFAVLVAGLIAAWARGWPILGFPQGGPVNWVLAALLIYLSIIPVILFVFVPREKVLRRALDAAGSQGEITPELRAAVRDPVAAAARGYMMLIVAVLAYLMVARPF